MRLKPPHTFFNVIAVRRDSAGPGKWTGEFVCCLALIAGCLVLGLPRYRLGIDFGDEGFLAYGAVRVMEGQMPNRDFVSLQPPLSFYTAAAAFKILGTSLATLRRFGLCLYTLIPLLVYAISRQRAGRLTSLIAAAPLLILGMPFFNFVPFAVWQGVTASLIAVLFILRAAITGRRAWALAAGAATALTILSRHDQGFYLALAVLTFGLILKYPGRQGADEHPLEMLAFWAAGTAVPLLLLAVPWLVAGSIPDMFKQLVLFPLTTYARTSSLPLPVVDLSAGGQWAMLASMFYLVPTFYVLAALRLLWTALARRCFDTDLRIQTFLLVFSILFYCQALTRSDFYHLLITLSPFFIVLAWTAEDVSRSIGGAVNARVRAWPLSWVTPTAILGTFGAIGAWLLLQVSPATLASTKRPMRALDLERGGVEMDSSPAESLEGIVSLIQKYASPDRSILSLPYNPMLYFLAERRNPTRWNYLWPGDQTADDHRAMLEQARNDPPAVIVISGEKEMQRDAPTIMDYVHSRFQFKEQLGRWSIYLPAETESR
jgi:hypothetical protein